MADLTKPIIHLNGSSGTTLSKAYREAYAAVEASRNALAASRPHVRDYYLSSDPDAFVKARDEHAAREAQLAAVGDELRELALHCMKS